MYGSRAKIAFMLPSSCTVFEPEFARMTAGLEGVFGMPARLLIETTDVEGLGEMNAGIELAARQLATTRPDVAVYMCTSGSFKDGQDGNQAIKDTLGRLIPGAKITTTSEAVVEAMRALGLRRVAMLTPYDEEVTRREIDYLGWHGVSVTDFAFRDIEDNLNRGAVSPKESYHFASQLDLSDADRHLPELRQRQGPRNHRGAGVTDRQAGRHQQPGDDLEGSAHGRCGHCPRRVWGPSAGPLGERIEGHPRYPRYLADVRGARTPRYPDAESGLLGDTERGCPTSRISRVAADSWAPRTSPSCGVRKHEENR